MILPYGHNQVTKQCLACGKSYVSYVSAKRKYCCAECRYAARREERGNCLICGEPIKAGRTKYCSMKCRTVDFTGRKKPHMLRSFQKTCEYCGQKFTAGGRGGKKTYQRYCSVGCSGAAQRNTVEHYWEKNGKTTSTEWNILRKSIIERENNCCSFCGSKGVPLQIHHAIPRRFGGDHNEKNLIAACDRCHWAVDKILIMIARQTGEDNMLGKIKTLMGLLGMDVLCDK